MRFGKTSLLAAAFLAGIATALPAGAAVIGTNMSFENGVVGDTPGLLYGADFDDLPTTGPASDVWSRPVGWNTVLGTGPLIHSDRSVPGLTAQDGDYFLQLDTGVRNSLVQNISLGIGRYMLSFWYSPQTTAVGTNSIFYAVGSMVSGTVSVGTNGATVGQWTRIDVEFISLTARSWRLTMRAFGRTDGIGGYIDNVSVAAVPVPAAGFGLLAALGGLAALRRRRKAA